VRVSLIVAAHNEGALLLRTLESCFQIAGDLDYEVIVADDGSTDGSIEEVRRLFPAALVHRHPKRLGASPAKALGAKAASGEILIFLDAHVKPEFSSLDRLAQTVIETEGQAIVTPKILALDTRIWRNDDTASGHGYRVDLLTFDCGWLALDQLTPTTVAGRPLYESPSMIGCAFAISRKLYLELRGFDPHMSSWGLEDLDLGLKCWLSGYRILHDPQAAVGHRFRDSFDNYQVPAEHVIANQLRMARKNFTESVWNQWIEAATLRDSAPRPGCPEGLWARAWLLFNRRRDTVEQERAWLMARRKRDEFWFATTFRLAWPQLMDPFSVSRAPSFFFAASPSPAPSPRPSAGPCAPGPTDPANVNAVPGAPPSRPLDPNTYGMTNPEYIEAKICAYQAGGEWLPVLRIVTGHYSLQARLLPPRQQEVTGPPPGNSDQHNFCPQVTELKALGYAAARARWYMLEAVVAHENVHATRLTPALRDHGVLDALKAAVERLRVSDTGQGETAAVAQIMALPGWAAAVASAYENWKAQYLVLIDHDHDPGGPTDQAEHAVVDPMIANICAYAKANAWGPCAECPP
jgi:glycosyltransferase involved in cell wall biosynthesis